MTDRDVYEFFESYAHDFDAIYGGRRTPFNRLIDSLFRRSMRLRYRKTILGCDPAEGRSALDIGCGPGHYAIALARMGMKTVWGIDFAPAMIDLAKEKAATAGVASSCKFIVDDFLAHEFNRKFDYTVLMGLMDYVSDPIAVVARALSLTTSKAFFSFPDSAGFLAWQRRRRYRNRCDLYMYNREEIEKLFRESACGKFEIAKISRDYFVTAYLQS